MKEHGGPEHLGNPEESYTHEPIHARDNWARTFMWGTAHFPQTYVGTIPLVELAVFSDLCTGTLTTEDFERSVLSPDQIGTMERVALAHDNIPGAETSHANNPRFTSSAIQDLWIKARDAISVKMTRLPEVVQESVLGDNVKVDKKQFFTHPQYTAECAIVMNFLQRVSASLRSEGGLALSRDIKTATVKFYQRPAVFRRIPFQATRSFHRHRKRLVSLIRGQIDQTRLPELQELMLVELNPEH